jgi:hypothetical protein
MTANESTFELSSDESGFFLAKPLFSLDHKTSVDFSLNIFSWVKGLIP